MTMVPARNLDVFPVLMTAAEVGALFGVSPKTVTRWARTGRLACYRAGGAVRFREHEVRALFAWSTS